MEEKIKIRTAADARRKFKTRELTASDVYKFLEESLADCNEDYVLNPTERLAPGAKEELEAVGFTITVLPDAFIPTRTVTVVSWDEEQPTVTTKASAPENKVLGAPEALRVTLETLGDQERVLESILTHARMGFRSAYLSELSSDMQNRLKILGYTVKANMNGTEISW